MRTLRKLRIVALAAAFVSLVGCETSLQKMIEDSMPEKAKAYQSSTRLPPLEIPPDLTSNRVGQSLSVPSSGEISYSDLQTNQPQGQVVNTEILPQQTDIRIERNGNKRWLVVDARPEQVWGRLRDFWVETGFVIKTEDASVGIIETDWAEKRSTLPKTLLESVFSKLSPNLYSAGTRDKFRSRIERGDRPGTTEIYVSHRGARQVQSSTNNTEANLALATDASFRWEPRPADSELEAEMLTRMMAFFGMEESAAKERMATRGDRAPRAHIVRDNDGAMVLALREEFSQAWRRTGLALDRVGFTVEDRDRSRGMYFVRYVDPVKEEMAKEKGILSSLKFWGDDDKPVNNEYLISLVGGENTTRVLILDKTGQREVSDTATRILGLLHDELK